MVLDLEPSHETEDNRALAVKEGQRFATFLGLSINADGTGPLRIQKLDPQGRGAEIGLAAGDVLEELSGVRLSDVSDFVPPPRAPHRAHRLAPGRRERCGRDGRRRRRVQARHAVRPSHRPWRW